MDCFDDLGDKFGRRSRSSSQVKAKTKSKVNKKKKKKTRMGKIIPFSTCLRLNRRKKSKGSDEPVRGTSMSKEEEQELLPGTSRQEPQSTSRSSDQPEEASSYREQEKIVPGKRL